MKSFRMTRVLVRVVVPLIVLSATAFWTAAFAPASLQFSQTQETGNRETVRYGSERQRTERDQHGRLMQLIDYDSNGGITHRQVYNYAPKGGTLEIIDYWANGTVERTLHKGGPNHLPWRVHFYRGLTELDMVIEYKQVRAPLGGRRIWQEWIIYESGQWLERPILSRSRVN